MLFNVDHAFIDEFYAFTSEKVFHHVRASEGSLTAQASVAVDDAMARQSFSCGRPQCPAHRPGSTFGSQKSGYMSICSDLSERNVFYNFPYSIEEIASVVRI